MADGINKHSGRTLDELANHPPGKIPARLAISRSVPAARADQGLPLVVVLLDTSASMGSSLGKERKIDVAWRAFQEVVAHGCAGHHLGILEFGVSVRWLLKPEVDASAISDMRCPDPGGETPLGQALRMARNRIGCPAPYGRIVLITDGEPTDCLLYTSPSPRD